MAGSCTTSRTYQEIKPPKKVVFTLAMGGRCQREESLLPVEFHDLGNSTEVTLHARAVAHPEERDKHAQGWKRLHGPLAKFL